MKNGNAPQLPKAAEALLYHILETEAGGVELYQKAVECAQHDELREEWSKYLEESRHHLEVARSLVEAAGLDPEAQHPSRAQVKALGDTLLKIMETSQRQDEPEMVQLTACECILQAETKDHQNWHLLGYLARHVQGALGAAMRAAFEEVEDNEDEHLYHTRAWGRELWLRAMDVPAVLPPPEERKKVQTAIGAARAEAARGPAARHLSH